ELECATGKVVAHVGDVFNRIDPDETWTIIGFGDKPDIVICSAAQIPGWARKYSDDGKVELCSDSVAAHLLEKADGKRRDARGHFLNIGSREGNTSC
ncbi:MAG: hypothetical protein JSR78_10940, partial [Proteobacteria bacterium]|nr:hypothetical protein [Pseudomonadota bacterium]